MALAHGESVTTNISSQSLDQEIPPSFTAIDGDHPDHHYHPAHHQRPRPPLVRPIPQRPLSGEANSYYAGIRAVNRTPWLASHAAQAWLEHQGLQESTPTSPGAGPLPTATPLPHPPPPPPRTSSFSASSTTVTTSPPSTFESTHPLPRTTSTPLPPAAVTTAPPPIPHPSSTSPAPETTHPPPRSTSSPVPTPVSVPTSNPSPPMNTSPPPPPAVNTYSSPRTTSNPPPPQDTNTPPPPRTAPSTPPAEPAPSHPGPDLIDTCPESTREYSPINGPTPGPIPGSTPGPIPAPHANTGIGQRPFASAKALAVLGLVDKKHTHRLSNHALPAGMRPHNTECLPASACGRSASVGPSSRSRRSRASTRKPRSRESSLDRDGIDSGTRSGSLRTSRSVGNLFHKTFSLRKRQPSQSASLFSATGGRELSTEGAAPGVLKVFGDSLIEGANYKSVLAVPSSSAKDLISEALERYGIPQRKAERYVLCDVIGRFVCDVTDQDSVGVATGDLDSVWTEECIRIISDQERPLVLQDYWKPSEGFSRRFELRKRTDFLNMEPAAGAPPDGSKRRQKPKSSIVRGNSRNSNYDYRDSSQLQKDTNNGISAERGESSEASEVKMPTESPYLVSLKCYDTQQDNLLTLLSKALIRVGVSHDLDLVLHAPDFPLNAELTIAFHADGACGATPCTSAHTTLPARAAPTPYCATVHVSRAGGFVRVNGAPVTLSCPLRDGDVLGLGKHYTFLFRNPTEPQSTTGDEPFISRVTDHPPPKHDVRHSTSHTPTHGHSSRSHSPAPGATTPVTRAAIFHETTEVLTWRRRRLAEYEADQTRLKLSYPLDREDDLLKAVCDGAETNTHPLSAAYLLTMAVEYSAVKHTQFTTRALLLRIASLIQSRIWEKTKELAEKQSNLAGAPINSAMRRLEPDLRPVVMWLANSLELLNHFRSAREDYVIDSQVALPACTRASIATAEDEFLSVLEDVVMYTFQQIVYYLTKTLYPLIPAIVESNPFQDDEMAGNDVSSAVTSDRPSVEHVISVYEKTLQLMQDYCVHPEVVSQLFGYLFFYTSTSVFNLLMHQEAAPRHYCWSRGVQMRGNVDGVEGWAADRGLGHEAGQYMGKVNALTYLLATPRNQLLQGSWTSLSASCSELYPHQLHHVLRNYQVGRSATPAAWRPPDALKLKGDLLEAFDSHPPLSVPYSGYQVALRAAVPDVRLHEALSHITSAFSVDDDGDSGLYVSQNATSLTDIPKNAMYIASDDSGNGSRGSWNDYGSSVQSQSSIALDLSKAHAYDSPAITPSKTNPRPAESPQVTATRFSDTSMESISTKVSGSGIQRSQSRVQRTQGSSSYRTPRSRSHDRTPRPKAYSWGKPDTNSPGVVSVPLAERVPDAAGRAMPKLCLVPEPTLEPEDLDPVYANIPYDMRHEVHIATSDTSGDSPPSIYQRSLQPPTLGVTMEREERPPQSPIVGGSRDREERPMVPHRRESVRSLVKGVTHMTPVTSGATHMNSGTPGVNHMTSVTPGVNHMTSVTPGVTHMTPEAPGIQDNDHIPPQPTKPAPTLPWQTHCTPSNHGNKRLMTSLSIDLPTPPPGAHDPYTPRRCSIDSSETPQTHSPSVCHTTPRTPYHPNVSVGPASPGYGGRHQPQDVMDTPQWMRSRPQDRPKQRDVSHRHHDQLSSPATSSSSSSPSSLTYNTERHLPNTRVTTTNQGSDSFEIELVKEAEGLGLGIIDGRYTARRCPGIFVRSVLGGGPAAKDGRLRSGDQLLRVNGSSLHGASYVRAMDLIRSSAAHVTLYIARSRDMNVNETSS